MKLGILGAGGWIGSAAAFHIAAQGLVQELVLVDVRKALAEQHAFDLRTAVFSQGVDVRVGTYADLTGSDIVINAAGVPHHSDRATMLVENISVIEDIASEVRRRCPQAILVTAGNPVDALNYATWRLTGFDRCRVVGYSLNDSLRFREFVAKQKGVDACDVDGTVMGEHGSTQVMLFSSVRVKGQPIVFTREEEDEVREARADSFRRMERLQKATGRTAGWTCAVGMACLVRSIVQDTHEVVPCSVVLEGEYGKSGLSMGVPVRLGRSGVKEILEWDINPSERADLDKSAKRLKADVLVVDQALSA